MIVRLGDEVVVEVGGEAGEEVKGRGKGMVVG